MMKNMLINQCNRCQKTRMIIGAINQEGLNMMAGKNLFEPILETAPLVITAKRAHPVCHPWGIIGKHERIIHLKFINTSA